MVRSATLKFSRFCRSGKRRRTRMGLVKSLLICASVGITIMLIMLSSDSIKNTLKGSDDKQVVIDLSNNYLQVPDKFPRYLVNTTKCRIPEFDIWDPILRPFIKAPTKFKCGDTYLSLTNVVKNMVIINETELKSMGYSLDQVTCCYQTIRRVHQTRKSYDRNADNLYRYSGECFQMEKITILKWGFIRVTCRFEGSFVSVFKYVNFHMIATLPHDTNSKSSGGNISGKLRWWKECLSRNGKNQTDLLCQRFREQGRPPNVLVLGWDSTSRSNFHRFMPRTVAILENVIRPVEMVGYNKVGENTLPNFVPLMTSLSLEELVKECYPNHSVYQDDCPYIWKNFSARKYLTVHLEDAPWLGIFNFLKTGFVKPPADIYSRSFMLAAYKENRYFDNYFIDCIGYQRPEEMILNYIVDLAEMADSEQIPYFLTTWLTDLTHDSMSNIQLADELMARTLIRLHDKGLLENTVLFLMSDHGYRFLEVRATTTGWFEDRLPTLWIKLPPSVVKVHPSWMNFLQQNSRQLITPFNLHEAFKNILSAYSSPEERGMGMDSSVSVSGRDISPFTSTIPDRSCEEARIPEDFCICVPPTACILNSSPITLAAERVVESINSYLPVECVPFKVAAITACGIQADFETNRVHEANYKTEFGKNVVSSDQAVIVSLQTKPGNFVFEATVHFNKSEGNHGRVFGIRRMNQKTTSTACLVKNDGWLELICYCDHS